MNGIFASHVDALLPAYNALRQCPPMLFGTGNVVPKEGGVYLFAEGDEPLYVGRSRQIRRRYDLHCRGGENQATFAFILARQTTGFTTPTYAKGEGNRKWLMQHKPFALAFDEAKQRIRRMAFHWVVEDDPVRQALLEIYCSIVMQTPHNSFKTT